MEAIRLIRNCARYVAEKPQVSPSMECLYAQEMALLNIHVTFDPV